MAKATTSDTSVAKLKAENKRLQQENAKLSAMVDSSSAKTSAKRHSLWRTIIVVFCISLAMALLVVGNLVFWTGRTLTDTDKFTSTIQPVLQQPEVQAAVSTYATNKLFENVDVEALLTEALPPRADFVAPALTSKIEENTQQTLQKAIATDQFQTYWISAVSTSHERFITAVKNYEGDGTIQLNDIYQRISQQLQDTKLSFLANKTLPANVGNITLIQADWLPVANNIVSNLSLYRFLTISLFILLLGVAIWVSRHRRRTVITISLFAAAMMLFTLISLRIGISMLVNTTAAEYQSAVNITATILTDPLFIQTRIILLLGLFAAIVAWISGPFASATATRTRITYLFEGKLHHALFSKGENGFTRFIAKYRTAILWSAVGLFAATMLFANLSASLVIWSMIFLVLFTLVIFLLSADDTRSPKK